MLEKSCPRLSETSTVTKCGSPIRKREKSGEVQCSMRSFTKMAGTTFVWSPSLKRHCRWLTSSFVGRKPKPQIVTAVPPLTGPSFGLMAVTMKCTYD